MSTQTEHSGSPPAGPPGTQPVAAAEQPGRDLSAVSLVLGPAALIGLLFPASELLVPLLGTAAIVTGVLALRRTPAGTRHRGVIGIVLGAAAVLGVATLLVSSVMLQRSGMGAGLFGPAGFAGAFTGHGPVGPGQPGPGRPPAFHHHWR